MKKLYTLVLFCATLLGACQQVPEHASTIATKPDQGFLVYSGEYSDDQVAIKSVSYANPKSGDVFLEFNLLNKSSKSLIVKYLLTELSTAEGLRSSPEFTDSLKNQLASGEEGHYELSYLPINSRELYTEIGYRGDLKPNYSVDLEFLGLKGKRLELKLAADAYAKYLANFGLEKSIEVFKIANAKKWEEEQKKCIQKPKDTSKPSSVGIHDHELLVRGVVCKLSAHQSKDGVTLRIRLANQSDQLINVIPEKLQLYSNSELVESDNFTIETSNRTNPKGKGLVLLKSERFEVNYQFNRKNAKMLELKDLGIYFEEKEQAPLLCYRLKFILKSAS